MSLARIGLLFVNADTQAATRLLQDLFPNPINCACGGRSDLKEPGKILGKHRDQPVFLKTLWATLRLVSNISCWSTGLTPLWVLVSKEGFAQDTDELLLSYFPMTIRTLCQHLYGHIETVIAERKKSQKYPESDPKSLYSTVHTKAHIKLHPVPVTYPRNSTDVRMAKRRYWNFELFLFYAALSWR